MVHSKKIEEMSRVKGNERGLIWAEGIVARWLSDRKIHPEEVAVEYIFEEESGAPVYGISQPRYERDALSAIATKRVGKQVATFSAGWGAVSASRCYLYGALVSSPCLNTIYGVIEFPVRHARVMVDGAVGWIRGINVDVWRKDGMPVLVHTKAGLVRQDDSTSHLK